MDITVEMIGSPAYGTSIRTYRAKVPLTAFVTANDAKALFAFPAGTTILAAKCQVLEATDGSVALDVGTYAVSTTGGVGTAVDADAIVAGGAITSATAEGAYLAVASTAHGAQMTADVIVQATAKTVTTAATKGTVYIEVATLQ